MVEMTPLVLVSSGSTDEGSLQLVDGDTISVGSRHWFDWLDRNGSFRFESGFAGQDSFTARKHDRDSGEFWYAYRKVEGKLRNAYLGKGDRLTVERMLEIAAKLTNPPQSKSQSKSKPQSYANECITEGVILWNVYDRVEDWDRKQKQNVWGEWRLVGSYKTEQEADQAIQTWKDSNHRLNSSMHDYGIVRAEWEKRLEVVFPASSSYAQKCITESELRLQIQALEEQNAQLRSFLEQTQAKLEEAQDYGKGLGLKQYELYEELDSLKRDRDRLAQELSGYANKCITDGEVLHERDELVELNHVLTVELDRLKTQSETSQPLPDLEVIRDRFLAGLRLGKQAPEYKRTKAVIDRFIAEVRREKLD